MNEEKRAVSSFLTTAYIIHVYMSVDGGMPPALQRAIPVMEQSRSALRALAAVFASQGAFRVFLDDACEMPSNWRSRLHIRLSSNSTVDDTKYGAESALPHMLARSPYVTSDWRRANASLVVLYAHRYGGPIYGPERCRRALEQRSAAWRATSGRRHFFVLTGDFGPCTHSGHLLSPALLGHHVIATHGELEGHHWHWGDGPDLPCFCAHKDISIPPSNWLYPPPSSGSLGNELVARGSGGASRRDLLVFYSGAGEFRFGKRQGRQLMLRYWGDGGEQKDPSILATWRLPQDEMRKKMRRAKFCPIFGGNSPWSTRLVEAMMNGCVPVFFSSWLPPFSRLLAWDRFSVRLPSLDLVPQLKQILEATPHERLAANLPAALAALWYRVDGDHQGDDMLPFLLVEMAMALHAAEQRPLKHYAERKLLGLQIASAIFDDDIIAKRKSSALRQAMFSTRIATAISNAPRAFPPAYRGGVTIVTNRTARGPLVWRCVPLTRNAHSYRETDPFDFDNATIQPGEGDSVMATLEVANCILVHPYLSRENRLALDPMSPTQVPANYSQVRANRAYFLQKRNGKSG